MTGNDLIVLVPWAVFCVGVAIVCLRLRRARRPSRRSFSPCGAGSRPSQPEPGDGPEADPWPPGQAAGGSQRGAMS